MIPFTYNDNWKTWPHICLATLLTRVSSTTDLGAKFLMLIKLKCSEGREIRRSVKYKCLRASGVRTGGSFAFPASRPETSVLYEKKKFPNRYSASERSRKRSARSYSTRDARLSAVQTRLAQTVGREWNLVWARPAQNSRSLQQKSRALREDGFRTCPEIWQHFGERSFLFWPRHETTRICSLKFQPNLDSREYLRYIYNLAKRSGKNSPSAYSRYFTADFARAPSTLIPGSYLLPR